MSVLSSRDQPRQKDKEEDAISNKDFNDLSQFFCQICFCPSELSNKASMDSCRQHDFCYECLLQWMMNKNTCPSCNVKVNSIWMPKTTDPLLVSQHVNLGNAFHD